MEHDTYLLLHEILREIKHMTSTVVDQVKLAHDEQKAAVTVLQGQVTAAVNELKALKDALTAAITAAQSIGPADAGYCSRFLIHLAPKPQQLLHHRKRCQMPLPSTPPKFTPDQLRAFWSWYRQAVNDGVATKGIKVSIDMVKPHYQVELKPRIERYKRLCRT
jgi:hypothetical protein